MTQINITHLRGGDLFAALQSGAKIVADIPESKPLPPPILWRPDALVLLVHCFECRCGRCYESPNQHILLRRTHPKEGVHLSAIEGMYDNPGPLFRDLPLITEYREPVEINQCTFCWDIEAIIKNATKEAVKL